MIKILIVDDEEYLASALKDNLELEGYVVDCLFCGSAVLAKLEQCHYDLVILDIMMPDIDGFQVMKEFRKRDQKTPVMFLSARSAENDRIQGLRLGADDYLVKPFSILELLERVRAILRRTAQEGVGDEMILNGRGVSFSNQTITHEGEEATMSHFEVKILEFLIREKGRVVPRYEILDEVWGEGAYPTDRTVDNYIAKLRQKLEDDPKNPQHLLTCHGKGYRWK